MTTKIGIISGFLGSGKTTFIQYLLSCVYKNKKVVLIENDFGPVPIDTARLQESNAIIKDISSGCVCCSLTSQLSYTLSHVLSDYSPDYILIEPSGIARLSNLISLVSDFCSKNDCTLEFVITMAAPCKNKVFFRNFINLYRNQLQYASLIIPTQLDSLSEGDKKEFLLFLEDNRLEVPIYKEPYTTITPEVLLSFTPQIINKVSSKTSIIRTGGSQITDILTFYFAGYCQKDVLLDCLGNIRANPLKFGSLYRLKGSALCKDCSNIQIDYTVSNESIHDSTFSDNKFVLIGDNLEKELLRKVLQQCFS